MIFWTDFQIDHPFGPALIPPTEKAETLERKNRSIMEDAKNQETRLTKQPARKVGEYRLDLAQSMEAPAEILRSIPEGGGSGRA